MGTGEISVAKELFAGAMVTLQMLGWIWLPAIPLSIFLAFRYSNVDWFRRFVSVVASASTVVPALVVLFWIHYPLQELFGVVWPPLVTSVVVLFLIVFASMLSILVDEFRRQRRGFVFAAKVLGITDRELARRVLLPTSLAVAVPRCLALAIASVHMTMFASLIGVEEIFRVTLRLNAQMLKPVQLFTLMALTYVCLCAPLYLIAEIWKKRLAPNYS